MSKKVPLTKRLEVALSQTSSDVEKDKVYGLLAITGRDSLKKELEIFYGTLTHETLSLTYNRKPISKEDIFNGKRLAEYLSTAINLPQAGTTKDYRGKMIAAMNMEYEVLQRYFKK